MTETALEAWSAGDVRQFMETLLPGHVCLERFGEHTSGRVLASQTKEALRRQLKDEEAANVLWAELSRLKTRQRERQAETCEPFPLFVRTPADLALELEVKPTDTIAALKERVARLEGTQPELQRLMWNGVPTLDTRSLASYGISHGAVMLLVPRLSSGAGRGRAVPLGPRAAPRSGIPKPRVPVLCSDIARPFPLYVEFASVPEYSDFMLALQRQRDPAPFLEILPAVSINGSVRTRVSFDAQTEALTIDTVGDILVEGARYRVILHLPNEQKSCYLVAGGQA